MSTGEIAYQEREQLPVPRHRGCAYGEAEAAPSPAQPEKETVAGLDRRTEVILALAIVAPVIAAYSAIACGLYLAASAIFWLLHEHEWRVREGLVWSNGDAYVSTLRDGVPAEVNRGSPSLRHERLGQVSRKRQERCAIPKRAFVIRFPDGDFEYDFTGRDAPSVEERIWRRGALWTVSRIQMEDVLTLHVRSAEQMNRNAGEATSLPEADT
jgi:hypothetical protein